MLQLLPRFYEHATLSFYHHSIFFPYGLVVDIFLAFTPLLLLALKPIVKKTGHGLNFLTIGINTVFVLYLPNTVYLALELKHLLLVNDGIADTLDVNAYAGFTGLSMLGLYLTIYTILKATRKGTQTVFLCFASAGGATLGMNGLNTLDVFIHPVNTVLNTAAIYTDWNWVLFTIILFLALLAIMGVANFILSGTAKIKSLL